MLERPPRWPRLFGIQCPFRYLLLLCHPAVDVEFEKHLVQKTVTEKKVGKEVSGVSAEPVVPADLFCLGLFYTEQLRIYSGCSYA